MNNQKFCKAIKSKQDHNQPANSTTAMTDDEKIDAAAATILKLYRSAFEKLAK